MHFDRDTCDNCTSAAQRLWHGFTGGCKGCCARAAARSPQAFEARKAGKQTQPYRSLRAQFSQTHDDVKAAPAADVDNRKVA